MTSFIPSIRCERLNLRALSAEDAVELNQIYHSEGVLQYFPNPVPPPLAKVQRFITNQIEHWEKYGYGDWAVELENEGRIIGWVGLQYLPELDETEVGFLFDRPFWGRGYATEAAKASLRFGFDHLNLDHIIALVHPDNLASQRVIEKCGMSFEGTLTLWGILLGRYRVENPPLKNHESVPD
jgi:[ribosomal protein S5]-alanine N-acetyltransferase